jgi:hypothetical protein
MVKPEAGEADAAASQSAADPALVAPVGNAEAGFLHPLLDVDNKVAISHGTMIGPRLPRRTRAPTRTSSMPRYMGLRLNGHGTASIRWRDASNGLTVL